MWLDFIQVLHSELVAAESPWRLSVIGMAFGGAVASFAYGQRELSRRKLFGMIVANTFIATMGVVLLPAYFGWAWVNSVVQPPLAAAISFCARFVIPVAVELAPQWLADFASKFISSKSTKSSEEAPS